MKITSDYSKTPVLKDFAPSFKGVNMVQISKKAFKNPENAHAVIDDFCDTFVKEMEKYPHKSRGFLDKIIRKFTKAADAFLYLETPAYIDKVDVLKENKLDGWPLSILSQKTGIPIKNAIDDDYHSFFILTNAEGRKADKYYNSRSQSKKAVKTVQQEIYQKEITSQEQAQLYYDMRMLQILDEGMENLIKGVPQKGFKVETLDDAKALVQKIMSDIE